MLWPIKHPLSSVEGEESETRKENNDMNKTSSYSVAKIGEEDLVPANVKNPVKCLVTDRFLLRGLLSAEDFPIIPKRGVIVYFTKPKADKYIGMGLAAASK